MENLGKVFYGLIVIAIGSIVNAYVISKLWSWIIVPGFGVDDITMGLAFGLSVISAFFRSKSKSNDDEDPVDVLTKSLVLVFINAAFYLLIGWIAGMFI